MKFPTPLASVTVCRWSFYFSGNSFPSFASISSKQLSTIIHSPRLTPHAFHLFYFSPVVDSNLHLLMTDPRNISSSFNLFPKFQFNISTDNWTPSSWMPYHLLIPKPVLETVSLFMILSKLWFLLFSLPYPISYQVLLVLSHICSSFQRCPGHHLTLTPVVSSLAISSRSNCILLICLPRVSQSLALSCCLINGSLTLKTVSASYPYSHQTSFWNANLYMTHYHPVLMSFHCLWDSPNYFLLALELYINFLFNIFIHLKNSYYCAPQAGC